MVRSLREIATVGVCLWAAALGGCCCGGGTNYAPWVVPGAPAPMWAPVQGVPQQQQQQQRSMMLAKPEAAQPMLLGLTFVKIKIINHAGAPISGTWGVGQVFGPIPVGGFTIENQNFPGSGVNSVQLNFTGGGSCSHTVCGGTNVFDVTALGAPGGQAACAWSCQ